MEQIEIAMKLNPQQQEQVANLFYDAFPLKVKYLWFFAKSREQAVELLAQSIQFEQGIYAIRNDEVIGFLGYNIGKKAFAPANYIAFRKVYPPFASMWRYFFYTFYLRFHLYDEDILQIDPIAVSEKAPGNGLGKLLLNEVEKLAKSMKITKINLEVVDTNPSAQKLYERFGYIIKKELTSGSFNVKAGFKKVIFMQKYLEVTTTT
ncbi:GNAT family N-acetyltransferase [Paenibacillus sp. JNUCC31]|uniref:GNAT family N-acetyltransferase n=1 Tax=Paenibacillus sp. JNUCC-31 TaxID=2777983 RepID=UPI0017805CB5|nr:GNAT family N-acetyltransferase [Paenibacillus sp. JNUCC-31]QOS79538.1 GNAT family N-acetyltransferase [Paenibacillus sp. JNUCC-31]